MIIQLPNGRIVECSIEQYLSLSDQEVNDLNGLSTSYTKEVGDPFYNKFSGKRDLRLAGFLRELGYVAHAHIRRSP